MKRILVNLSTLVAFGCLYIFYEHYWKRTFNEEGKYFDPIDGLVYNDNSQVWGLLAALFLLPALVVVLGKFWKFRGRTK